MKKIMLATAAAFAMFAGAANADALSFGVYGVVTLDSELEYSETVVGVAVKF